MTIITRTLGTWLLLTALLLAACTAASEPEPIGDVALASSLRSFDGCDALTAHLRREASDLVTSYGLQGAVPFAAESTVDRAATPAAGAEGSAVADSAGTFSTTNVQEAGVDEADLVKTDGTHVYTVTDGVLRIIDVGAQRPQLAATLQLSDGWPRDMLLRGDDLLVLGDADGQLRPVPESLPQPRRDGVEPLVPWNSRTQLWLIDVSDPSTPVERSTMTVDGSLLTSRLTGPTARVVVRSDPWLNGLVTPTGGPDAQEQALASNRARVAQADARDWLPRMTIDGAQPAPLVDCASVHAPKQSADMGMVSVLSLDLRATALTADTAQAVLGAADTVYASADSLYVTTSNWPRVLPIEPVPLPVEPEPLPPVTDPPVSELPAPVAPVAPVEPDVPADDTPSPLAPDQTVTTDIHRFELTDDAASYAASGAVPGSVLNQWALSEHDGRLRIATTEDAPTDADGSASAVRVLEQRGARLVEVGHVGDLGRGERIFAVRYAGAVGYVVTFRQIDPLYTLDLSDPTDPRVIGELKIPGYSAYLHPIGDDHVLGVGQDADRDGRVRGVQISMFDITDLSAPKQVGKIRLGRDTNTDVEFDHRALLYWPDRDLVVVPVQRWSTGDSGALVLTADGDGRLARRGLVRQRSAGQGPAMIQRSLIVEDRLVTVGPSGLMVSDLDSLEALGSIGFDPFER